MDIGYPFNEARRVMCKRQMSVVEATFINTMLENIANREGWHGLTEFTKQCGDYYAASKRAGDVLERWRNDLAELHRVSRIPPDLAEKYEINVVENDEVIRWYIGQDGVTLGVVTKVKGE